MYLGEDLSFTPLHHDVCMSHSWSSSLCGTYVFRGRRLNLGIKIWTLIPPEYTKYLSTLDLKSINEVPPDIRENAIKVTQYPGETIFVPSGWYHQVINYGS